MEFLTTYWVLMIANPVPFLLVGVALFGAGYRVAKAIDRGTIETLRERLDASRDDLKRSIEKRTAPERSPHLVEPLASVDPEPPPEVPPTYIEEEEGDVDEPDDPDEEEEDVLKFIADIGIQLPFFIAEHFGMHPQKGTLICERLEGAGYLESIYGFDSLDGYVVTRKGRQYLADNDLLE